MMSKATIFTICTVLGAAVAEPLRVANDEVEVSEYPSYEMAARTDPISLIQTIWTLIGYKFSAVSLAVSAISWAVSHVYVIAFGAAAALGFCKITGKCNLNYEEYIPISQIETYATPENLRSAESLLMSAVEKYADERRKREA